MYSEAGFSDMARRGFPHSDICASTPACGSAQLIAANHVLLRLLTPRHPPSALSSLTTSLSVSTACSPQSVAPDPAASGLPTVDRRPSTPCGVKAKVRFSRMSCLLLTQRISHV